MFFAFFLGTLAGCAAGIVFTIWLFDREVSYWYEKYIEEWNRASGLSDELRREQETLERVKEALGE